MFDLLCIILISLLSGGIAELLCWYFVYQTEQFLRLKSSAEQLQTKIDKKKESNMTASRLATTELKSKVGGALDKESNKAVKEAKKLDDMQEQMKQKSLQFASIRFKTTAITTVLLVATYQLLAYFYSARVIARLPFTPFSFFANITHRTLFGDDLTQLSFAGVFALSQLGIRSNLTRVFNPMPKGLDQSPFQALSEMQEKSK